MPVSSEHEPHPPHDLDLVIDFVNTLDAETGEDRLAGASGLATWLAEQQLLARAPTVVRESQRREAVRLREALRELMKAHNGLPVDPAAARELERVGLRGRLAVEFAADGSSRLAPRADGFAGALAMLLLPVIAADADGSWRRVKACRADDCHWAFYDHSRNRAGVWCDMAVCGNRTKVRTYRSKRPATPSTPTTPTA